MTYRYKALTNVIESKMFALLFRYDFQISLLFSLSSHKATQNIALLVYNMFDVQYHFYNHSKHYI